MCGEHGAAGGAGVDGFESGSAAGRFRNSHATSRGSDHTQCFHRVRLVRSKFVRGRSPRAVGAGARGALAHLFALRRPPAATLGAFSRQLSTRRNAKRGDNANYGRDFVPVEMPGAKNPDFLFKGLV